MISTENTTSSTVFTVSDTPSSVTEPLGGDEARQFPCGAQFEPRHVRQIVAPDDASDAVGVTGDNMAAEFVADLQRPLEIEFCALDPVLRRGHAERLGGGIDFEPGPAAFDAGSDHSKADAVAGDRGAVGDGWPVVAAGDAHAVQLALRGRA